MKKLITLLFILFSIVACSQENSVESIQQKAESGDAVAQFKLGYMYEKGEEGVERNSAIKNILRR